MKKNIKLKDVKLIKILIIINLVFLHGCQNDFVNVPFKGDNSLKDESQNSKNESGDLKIQIISGVQNESVEIGDGQKLTVLNAEKYIPKYSKHKDAEMFIKIKLKMENKSEATYSPNIFESKIIDEKGNYREMDFSTFSVDDYFENTNILSGETREGTIIFAVPENDKNLTFVYNYSGDIYKKVEIKFNINVEENK
mgnify:FL=1